VKELTSQFRCVGSADYVRWLDKILDMGEQDDIKLQYDVAVEDDYGKLRMQLEEWNCQSCSAKLVAGVGVQEMINQEKIVILS